MNNVTCSIVGCDATVRATGWCKRHYNTWYRTGDPLSPPHYIPNDKCRADGCNTAPRSKMADYCEMHYGRLRRNGTLFNIQRPTECVAPGCAVDVHCCGMCQKHHGRFNRHGHFDALAGPGVTGERNHSWTGDDASYRAVHMRITNTQGPARLHQCVDCTSQAAHWSYDHGSGIEQQSEQGFAYSTDMSHYQPRCVSCHKAFDLNRIDGTDVQPLLFG